MTEVDENSILAEKAVSSPAAFGVPAEAKPRASPLGTNEENGNVSFRVGGRCDRGRYEYKDYAYIKTSILQKI